MANKPERFSQDEIRREKISPEEIDTWVRYVKEEKYEAVKKAGIPISEDDIRVAVHLRYLKNFSDFTVNGDISVKTKRPGGYESFYVIAPFYFASDAEETFRNYANFKNVVIIEERDDDFLAKRKIELSV